MTLTVQKREQNFTARSRSETVRYLFLVLNILRLNRIRIHNTSIQDHRTRFGTFSIRVRKKNPPPFQSCSGKPTANLRERRVGEWGEVGDVGWWGEAAHRHAAGEQGAGLHSLLAQGRASNRPHSLGKEMWMRSRSCQVFRQRLISNLKVATVL